MQVLCEIKECFLSALLPYFMSLTMSWLILACQLIENKPLMYVATIACLAIAMAYIAFLVFGRGRKHYEAYTIGCIHRENERLGIQSGKNHRIEREYRPWKGFVIGFIIGIPVILLSLIAGFSTSETLTGGIALILVLIAGWAIIPVSWFSPAQEGVLTVSPYFILWSMLLVLLPVLVSGIFYILGAMKEKRIKEAQKARLARVEELARQQKKS